MTAKRKRRSKSPLCRSSNTLDGKPCEKPVSAEKGSRHCHYHRFCGPRGDFWLFVDAYRERKRRRAEVVRASTGVTWQRQVTRRARAVAGRDAWSAFEQEWTPEACKTLAELARGLDAVDRIGQQELTALITGPPGAAFPATRAVATAVASRIVVSEIGGPAQAARALRVLGVLVCVALGRTDECPCWRAMAKEGIDQAREQLREGVPTVTAS